MVQPRVRLEKISCCHFQLFYCCVATSCAAVVLHMVLPRDWTRENQLLSPLVYFTAVLLPGLQLSSSTWSRLVSGWRESAAVTSRLTLLLFATWCTAVVFHKVQPRVWTGENQLLLLLVNFTAVPAVLMSFST